jgi:hypothetical protein
MTMVIASNDLDAYVIDSDPSLGLQTYTRADSEAVWMTNRSVRRRNISEKSSPPWRDSLARAR